VQSSPLTYRRSGNASSRVSRLSISITFPVKVSKRLSRLENRFSMPVNQFPTLANRAFIVVSMLVNRAIVEVCCTIPATIPISTANTGKPNAR
jgi:hypothetical protein